MRILHVSYDGPGNIWVNGGGAKRTRELQRRLREKGHTFDWTHASRAEQATGKWMSRLIWWRRARRDLHFVACKMDYDVITYEFSPFSPIWIPWELRRKVILSLYHIHDFRSLLLKVGVFAPICWLAQWWAIRRWPHKLALSPAMGRKLDCPHIPPGVDEDLFEMVPVYTGDLYSDEAPPFFLFLGRFDVEMKGIDILLDAWEEIDERLLIAGRGDIGMIDQMVIGRGLYRRVTVVDNPDENHKRALLQHCRALVMPSRYEGWGITAVEAQAAGKAVIGSPAVKDAIYNVPCDGPVEGIRYLVGQYADESHAKAVGRGARAWARQFSWPAMTYEMEQFLETHNRRIRDAEPTQ